jgi:hypothetical protein
LPQVFTISYREPNRESLINSTRCCYLHIGTHKTGTSTIQHALALQSDRVAEAGFIFPHTGRLTSDSGQHELAQQTNSPEQSARVESLLAEIAAVPHHVILSSEEFSHMLWVNPSGLQHLIDRLSTVVERVVVVLYLRRQADYIESNYPQRLRSRFCLDFSTYVHTRMQHDLAEFTLNYAKLTAKLDDLRGIEMVVRSYDALNQVSVLNDFLGVIGWPADIPLTDARVNAAPDLVESLKNFCRAQQQRELSEPEERVIELITSGLPARPHMDSATRRAVVQHFDESNRLVASRFDLPALLEEAPPERRFGPWLGLGSAPPPDHAALPSASLDNLYSRDFVTMVATLAERFGAMDVALAEAQRLATERFAEMKTLRAQLDRTEAALGDAQRLATGRNAETNALRAQLDQTQAALGDAQMLAQQRFADLEALRERPASAGAGQATQQASKGPRGLRRWLRSRL